MAVKTINFPCFQLMLMERCAFYGMTEYPLTLGEAELLHSAGVSIEDAYNVACDVANGWPFWESAAYVVDCEVLETMA